MMNAVDCLAEFRNIYFANAIRHQENDSPPNVPINGFVNDVDTTSCAQAIENSDEAAPNSTVGRAVTGVRLELNSSGDSGDSPTSSTICLCKDENVGNLVVTMTINVDYKQHSYFIGNGGSKVRNISRLTGCKIQFPNNHSSLNDKSNAVILIGTIRSVEHARSVIKSQTQLVLSFPVPFISVAESNKLMVMREIVDLQADMNVKIAFYCNTVSHMSYCRVFGTEGTEETVALVARQLMTMFCPTPADSVISQTKISLPVIDRSYVFLKRRSPPNRLSYYTNTKVEVGRPEDVVPADNDSEPAAPSYLDPDTNKNVVIIEGHANNVVMTRRLFRALLPVELMFEVPEIRYSDVKMYEVITACPHLAYSVGKSRKNRSYHIALKTSEFFIDEIYRAYAMLAGCDQLTEVYRYKQLPICHYFQCELHI